MNQISWDQKVEDRGGRELGKVEHLGAVEDFFIQLYTGFLQRRRLVSMYGFYSFQCH